MISSKRVLVIGYVWPEPSSSAAGAHIHSLLSFFIEHDCDVTFSSPAQQTDRMLDLSRLGVKTAKIALNCSSFDEYIAKLSPDIVMYDRFMMEEQFGWRVEKSCPNALTILDSEDLFCLRHARHDQFKRDGKINPEITSKLLFTDLAKREIAAILRCDLTLIISEFEQELLIKHFRIDPSLLVYTPFMLDPITDEVRSSLPSFESRSGFISIGNFRHPPNWDSVLFLKQSVWPLIRKKLPKVQLHVYGAYTPPKAMALNKPEEGFWVKGWAEDTDIVMRNAKVNFALVRFGAGLKGKLIDAMKNGTPSVSTTIGAEAMAGDLAFCGVVADDPEVIAEQAVNLYVNQQDWQQASANGDRIYHGRFDKQTHWKRLLDSIEACIANLAAHRVRNFTGAMLRHHTLKSTQYMSQWIELKQIIKQEKERGS